MVRIRVLCRWGSMTVALGLGMAVILSASRAPADPQRGDRLAAPEAVREALHREIYGLSAERKTLLQSAASLAPQYAPARWHLGEVKDSRQRWISVEEFAHRWSTSRKNKQYLEAREQAADTAAGQLALAEYCRREGLFDQMRSHLWRVLAHDENHAQARQALGFVRRGPLWLSREEIEAEQAQARAEAASLAKWRREMEQFAVDLSSESPKRRTVAAERLLKVADSSAIAAMERIVSPASDAAASAVIAALQEMPQPEASLSLARHAVLYPTLPVREQASLALARRDLHSYVPALIDMMVKPIESRAALAPLAGGRIGFRQVFVQETADREDVLVLDSEYERVDQGGSDAAARRRAARDILTTAVTGIRERERRNTTAQQLNERIAWALNRATQQALPAVPETWWQWWNDQNERIPAQQKTLAVSQVYRRVQIVDPVPLVGGGTQGGGGGGECLVAGTLIWTASGPTAVEKVQRGDLVLAKDVETGELTFKPVLQTTTRPKGKVVKFTAGHETFECSGGHVFWIAGDGWKKASQLEPGMQLHAAEGPLPILSVESGAEAETFNLIVADFSTYFVGQQKILSHDFTMRKPTSAIVPGLKAE